MDEYTHTVTITESQDDAELGQLTYGFFNSTDAWSFFKQEEEYIIEEFHRMPNHTDGQTFEYSKGGFVRTVELKEL